MIEELQSAGMTKNQALSYVALCKLGQSTAYAVAKEAKIFKANAYQSLMDLAEMGLVSYTDIKGKRYYEASNPDFIFRIIYNKEKELMQIIPQLRLLRESAHSDTLFHVYKGADSYLSILYHLLEYNDPILIYGASMKAYEIMKRRVNFFHEERIKRKIYQKHIYNTDARERIRELMKIKLKYTPIKVLPPEFDSNVTTTICGEEIIFCLWNPPIKVIQIKDKDMARAYKNYFYVLWKKAKLMIK